MLISQKPGKVCNSRIVIKNYLSFSFTPLSFIRVLSYFANNDKGFTAFQTGTRNSIKGKLCSTEMQRTD